MSGLRQSPYRDSLELHFWARRERSLALATGCVRLIARILKLLQRRDRPLAGDA